MRCRSLAFIGLATAWFFSGPATPLSAQTRPYDVVVYGGTSGGVIGAVHAAEMGKTVVLIEPGRHLGGLSSGGLGATDIGNKAAIGGLSRHFYRRIKIYYDRDPAWVYESRDQHFAKSRRQNPQDDAMWTFEPHVAERIFNDMIREAGVTVVFGQRLDRSTGVEKAGNRIASITMESGLVLRGRMFIDATYEGDLMAAAGVSYTVGRESNSQYGETLNGAQPARNVKNHRFIKPVDPYIRSGDATSGLLPGVQRIGTPEAGVGDRGVQAYCFRMCTTDVPENRRAWPKPADYDERRYELLFRNLEAGDHRIPWNPVAMPNRKTDTNNNYAFSTDYIGGNYDYPDADYATRQRIIDDHISYQKGLMWTLANHPRVPENVRGEFQRLGLARDDFVDNENWPHQLYVREARRMVSDYVMSEHNCTGTRIAEDSVGMGAYGMDSHNVLRYVDENGHVQNEGDIQVHGFSPYPISYRSITPRAGECENLFVPVCVSATHISYGSIRMEPVFMVLGQSAATAACMAIDDGCAVQELDYQKLRARLLADEQVLEWTGPARVLRFVDPASFDGIVVDDSQAQLVGDWTVSRATGKSVGDGYRHDGDVDKGQKSARFALTIEKAGRYEIRIAYAAHSNRATDAPLTIEHADGVMNLKINQRKTPPIDGLWLSLGEFRFDQGKPAAVTIRNATESGYVIIDAVQALRR